MGHLLIAKRREARAILKDDLRRLKEKHARELANNHRTVAQLQRLLADSERAKTAYSNDAGRANTRLRECRERVDKVLDWSDKNRRGDFTVRACAEFIQLGAYADPYGAGLSMCNPFDRWQVLPAIK